MNSKQLKQLIKPLIKECMAELMLEMRFEQVIGESISRALNGKQQSVVQETRSPVKDPKIEEKRLAARRKMLDEQHGSRQEPKNILESVLRDTEESGYSIGDGNTNPELVSEDTVDELVGGQDYSKYL